MPEPTTTPSTPTTPTPAPAPTASPAKGPALLPEGISPTTPYIGVDLGGTNMQIGVVTPTGVVISRAKRKTEASEGQEAVLSRMISGIEEACDAAGIEVGACAGLGIGAPGPIDPHTGVVLEAVNLGWINTPLAALLKKRTGLPTELDNDVNVALYGEWVAGCARGTSDVLGVWLGTGIGGGLIFGGKMHYGHFMTAGEIGHMLVKPENPPGSRSFEHNCSRTALCNRVRQLVENARPSIVTELTEGKLHKIKSKTLAEAYKRKDPLVTEIIDDAKTRIGIHIAGVVTLLSVEMVVLGGGLTEAMGPDFIEDIRKTVHQFVFPARCREVKVVASELEDNAGVVGAALIARDRIARRV